MEMYNDYEITDYLKQDSKEDYDPTIKRWVDAGSMINDKEIMVSMCNCDRHGDAHLPGCAYADWKEYMTKQVGK